MKMVRRNSKTSDQKKAERFRSMNYDPTLRNIKAKYLMKEEVIEGFKKSMEVQVGESLLALLNQCKTPVDPTPEPPPKPPGRGSGRGAGAGRKFSGRYVVFRWSPHSILRKEEFKNKTPELFEFKVERKLSIQFFSRTCELSSNSSSGFAKILT